jgi:hypothetical protein
MPLGTWVQILFETFSNTLSNCFSQYGMPGWWGLDFWDYSIGSIATGKLN